ncbi:hypothetical protein MSG28_000735 [Choristoneura fumiferana]|uniref:Uncharacterized protein n=1 Tax=Choristoneura fumiferana TaxID=7141 RepID=A0ACC0K1Z8_CHOFU|nr:hypothetical protein MSG28_000735 [Choristoneura fumiferana]
MSAKNEKNDPDKKGESNCNCYSKSRSKTCPPVLNITHPLRYYEFTQDEIKALEECDKESFYHRCLPFSTLFASVTYAAIRWGFLKRNPHFGPYPKLLLAVLFGHFYGRYHFIPDCDRKLRKLPANSHLGNVMRKYHCEKNTPDPMKRR